MTDENQFDERIRASLSRRAESVEVEPDLAGLARQAGPRRSAGQRFPLVAVAIVIAALAVTTAALRPASDRDSHLISRSGNQRDRTEDPTTTTSGAGSTSRSKPNHKSTTISTNVPSTPVPPDGTTPESPPNGTPDDTREQTPELDPGADPCDPVPDEVFARKSWEDDEVLVVEIGSNEGGRDFGVWRDTGGSDPCHQRVTDTGGQPVLFHLDTLTPEAQVEVHAFGCSPSSLKVVNGRSADGSLWFITVETYVLDGIQATLVGEPEQFELLEADDHDTIASLRETNCGDPENGG